MAKKTESVPKDIIQISDRALPADVNAEAGVLSAMIIDSGIVSKGIETIKEEYFSRAANKLVFRSICELFYEGVETDPVTLASRMERNNPS